MRNLTVELVKRTSKKMIIETEKLKGIKKSVVKKLIYHDHYRKCLFQGKTHYKTMKSFHSTNHQ